MSEAAREGKKRTVADRVRGEAGLPVCVLLPGCEEEVPLVIGVRDAPEDDWCIRMEGYPGDDDRIPRLCDRLVQLATVEEVAGILGLKASRVRQLARAGRFGEVVRAGGAIWIRADGLAAYRANPDRRRRGMRQLPLPEAKAEDGVADEKT